MDRQQAAQFLRDELNKWGLTTWGVRLNQSMDSGYLGLCLYKDKVIVLNAHHIDIHPDPDVINTIRHEVAHALCPGQGHNEVWEAKAREVGCDNTLPCSNLSLTPSVIDAIRSGATIEVTFTEQIIRTPKYTITRLQDKCEVCGKVAKTLNEQTIENDHDTRPNLKIIKLECGHVVTKRIPKGTAFHTFQMGGDPTCKHAWDKNKCKLCGRFRPYDFQINGMRFLEAALAVNKGGACFDDMGLGKTIQAGGVIYFHPEWWPTLWVVKSSLKYQTAAFLLNWLGADHVPQVIESSKEWLIPGLKHYIIGYDMLVPKVRQLKSGKQAASGFDITQFNRVGIKCVVLDECQQIKNVDSTRTQMVRKLVASRHDGTEKGVVRKVIPLSGTPWNNRGSELFPVMNMMDPIKFHSEENFKRQWVDTYWVGARLKEGGIKNITRFKEYTKDICIRRERKEVLPELPLINRTKLYVKMDLAQEKVYDEAVEDFVEWYQNQAGEISGMALLAAMQKMRHLVALAKIPATLEYVDEFVEDTDRKLVVFAHHKDCQALLYDELKEKYGKDMPVLKFVSGMSGLEINEIQSQFNTAPRALLVASELAAGEGLNLQTCADCIMHERQWNPGKEEQAEGRFIRIGQQSEHVNAVYTHMDGLTAIDSSLDQIVERKRIQFSNWTGTDAPRWNEDSIIKELAESIIRGYHQKKGRAA